MTLRVGFIGSGFNTRFHMLGWQGVREADVTAVWSPNFRRASDTARFGAELDIGRPVAYKSITAMLESGTVDAVWLCGPNHARLENLQEVVDVVRRGRASLKGIACEKPLARTVAEAKEVERLAASIGVKTGYLENQLFAPHVEAGKQLIWARGASTTGRPYLARAAEEHSGPHGPWFWQGRLQGGGVLNDMMCHSALVVRWLLTHPEEPLSAVAPRRVTGHIASLKWSRPHYAKDLQKRMGKDIDYLKTPSEDFAAVNIEFETPDGIGIGEATTSWSFVGAGLRLSAELLGPEYSMRWNSLDSGLQCFFSREVKGRAGEDLVEKQNAEQGVMPVVPQEYLVYGYTGEDRHFVRVFLGKEAPRLTFRDGREVVEMLMTAYKSAEAGKTLPFSPKAVANFVPAVARGAWKP